MKCKTIKGYGTKKDGSKGRAIFGNKVKYDSLQEAQAEADRQNAHPKSFIKREAYKCSKCKKFHVGKGYDLIEGKVAKPKKDRFRSLNIRVVGKIDLSQFEPKPVGKKLGLPIHHASLSEISPEIPKTNRELRKKLKIEIKNGIVGGIKIEGQVWKYYSKENTVKVITPNGRIRFVKYNKLDNSIALQRNRIVSYIMTNNVMLENGK